MCKKFFDILNDAREGFVLLTHSHWLFREGEEGVNSRFWGIFLGWYIAICAFIYRMYILHMGDPVVDGQVNRFYALIATVVLLGIFWGWYDFLIKPRISFHKVDPDQSKQQRRYKIWLYLGIGFGGVASYFVLTEVFKFYRDYIYFR